MESVVVTVLVWVLIFVGLAGTILPVLPGVALVFGGILLYALYFGVATIGLTTLILLGVATALSFVLDLMASLYGAKRFGATRAGMIGSILGGVGGLLFLNIPGLLLGTFVGAVIGESFVAKQPLSRGVWAGVGSILGFLASSLTKFVLALVLIGVFVVKIWF